MSEHYLYVRLGVAMLVLGLFSRVSVGQIAAPSLTSSSIIFQSPKNADTYVPIRTTLIIRPTDDILKGLSPADFLFEVNGEVSGHHTGSTVIADDYKTVIFKPDAAFTLNESVHVKFTTPGEGKMGAIIYSFRTTPLSDAVQANVINTLRRNEQKELDGYINPLGSKKEPKPLQLADSTIGNVEIYVPDKVAPGHIFAAQAGGGANQHLSFLAIVDNKGFANYLYDEPSLGYLNFRAYKNLTLSYFRIDTVLFGSGNGGRGFVLDSTFSPIDSFECGNGYIADEHEFQYLRKRHAYLIAYDTRDTDMRVVTGDPKASKHSYVVGAIIQELDSKKNVIFQWRSWDHFQISDMVRYDLTDPNHTVIDYTHANSVRQDSDGNLLASFKSLNEVTKINRENGKIIWRFGGKNNYFTLKGDTLLFSGQHDAHTTADGHLIMMDNGVNRTTQWGDGSYHDTSFSRVIEYEMDENSLTANAVWQFRNMPTTYAGGNVQRLDNGNTFIGLGAISTPNGIEVTPEGEKVFQIAFAASAFKYRTFRYEYPIYSPFDLSATPTPTGMADRAAINSIFPNPAHNTMSLKFAAPTKGLARIDILNALGATVQSMSQTITESGEQNAVIDLQGLASGSYYCRLSQNSISTSKPFVIER
ncbi:MAG: aryl-sulfate sulfotransferase [Ignavibacteriota bacterium]